MGSFSRYKLRECVYDVVDNRGKNPPSGYFDNGEYPVLDNYLIQNTLYPDLKKVKRYINQDVYENFLRGYLEKDDVIVTLVGNGICNASLSPSSDVVIIQNTIGIKTNEKLKNRFLYYYFLHNQKALVKLDRGSSQPSVNKNDLLDFEIEIPNLPTQQKIAAVLSALDAKIELNTRINAELESMAKTLYDYWFVQFAPHKSAGGKMVWNEGLKREIPLGWEVVSLGDFVDIFDSKRIPLSNAQRAKMQGNYPYYGATSIMDYINDYIFDGEYLLIAEDGSVMGDDGLAIVQYIWGKTWVNNHAHVLSPKDSSNKDYLYFLLKSISVIQIMTGSIQKKITQDNLLGVKFALPDKETLKSFSEFARPIRKRMINIFEESQTLTELRDWLLPMLMNGQVSIKT